MDNKHFSTALLCAFIGILPACSSDGEDPPADNRDLGTPNPDGKPGNAQTPPTTTASAMEAWLSGAITRAGPAKLLSTHS